ncbi:AAA family ATPase [Frankia sp. Ag45/Mut15]|uniref:AAA family ATPase n=1 Tax=Frankia umida TaxID=573489 RepID=A0ABT0JZ47_9ACTN|nr:LuxR family transcriptional regulator [Frankia umida]MCK9876730.1 AAA family ATPase [Frankia umida]
MSGTDRPFVGRQAELAALRTRLRDAAHGHGGVALISGPAGIGKTRLLEELLRASTTASTPAPMPLPLPVGRGYCRPDHGTPPLWPWQQALRSLARAGAGLSESRRALDAVGQAHVPIDPPNLAAVRFAALADAADTLLAAASATTATTTAAASGVPWVLVLEDVHWADANTLELVRQVAAGLADACLLLVLTARDHQPERDSAWSRLHRELPRLPRVHVTHLPPLPDVAVGEYLRATGTPSAGPDLARQVARRCGGLPLLLDVAATGAGRPVRVGDLVDVLLGQVPADARPVLRAAGLLRGPVDVPLLAAAAAVAEPAAAAAVDAAHHTGLMIADVDADADADVGAVGVPRRFVFAHGLLAETLAAHDGDALSRTIHQRAATALEARAGLPGGECPPGVAADIAAHWSRAGCPDQTARWARIAAAQARQALAFDDAVAHLSVAVAASRLAGAEPGVLAEALLELARAHYLAGNLTEALRHCAQAAAAQPACVATAALVVRWVTFPEAADVVAALCRQALATDQPASIRAQLLSQLATIRAEAGDADEARPLAREAMTLAATTTAAAATTSGGGGQALLDAARASELLLTEADDVHERLRLADLAARQAATLGQSLSGVLAEQWRLRAAYQLGQLDVVDTAMTAIARLTERGGLPLARWHLLRGQAARAVLEGRFAAGRAHDGAAGRLARSFGDPLSVGLGHAWAQHLAGLRGDPADLPADLWKDLQDAPSNTLMTAFRANALLLAGHPQQARACYERLRPQLDDPVVDVRWAGVLVQAIDLVEAFGDAATARLLARRLAPLARYPGAHGIPTVLFVGAMDGPYGRALAHAGDLPAAEAALRRAIDADRALGARPYVVLGRLALADVLRRRGRPDAAVPVATAAATEARRLDMPGPGARADQLLAALPPAARGRAHPHDVLTVREREVASLVVQARSNRQIAETLVLSERTVESHVRNILAKLGCTNRTQLVARWRADSS